MSSEQGADARYVVDLRELAGSDVARAGGKAARLAELSRIDGVHVPPGFAVTTCAFRRALAENPAIGPALDGLSGLDAGDREAIRELSAEARRLLEAAVIGGEVVAAVASALAACGERLGYAVRSSATAEDLPSASFAGQHESWLGVVGQDAVLERVRGCWASLFSERAVSYRLHNGLDHRAAQMAVVVQRMARAQAAGVLFTVDPVTSNRRVASIEATLGLGEPLVSGLVDPDVYTVRDGAVIARTVAAKRVASTPSPAGGIRRQRVEPERARRPALEDAQALALVELGRRIEARFGAPQDIEWCLADGGFAIVQSRPVTTLFPVPERDDEEPHVYVSVGHQQMMTDPMKALGLSVFQLTALRPMHAAGGRLFVDVAADLASPAAGPAIIAALGRSDPLIGDALAAVLDSGFIAAVAGEVPARPPGGAPALLDSDPAIVAELVARGEASLAALRAEIRTRSGVELLDFILADIPELKRLISDPRSSQAIRTSLEAARWLDEHLGEWLGETNATAKLTLSVPGNITSEMGLALLDLADAIRPHAEVVAALEQVEDEEFLDALAGLPGGALAREAIRSYLDRYGMRCAGEIDITRPRWSERPSTLVPAIHSNHRNFAPGAARRRFQQGSEQAAAAEVEVLERLRALPGGRQKAWEAKEMIDRMRTFAGYREYPKYCIVSRYLVYKHALLAEAGRLAGDGVLEDREDIFHLTLPELREVVRAGALDEHLIAERTREFGSYGSLAPPRVLTSDGEVFTGSYRRTGAPAGALVGLPVSGGVVEGRARVVLDIADAELEPGDVLVTTYTDPSWSPLFLTVAALVTEVGGLTTHGAVIAREYGLPAVVGVERATQRIPDGRRIRVDASGGYVELLA